VVQYALEKNGFAVQLANDGRAALALIEAHKYDLVVLDIMLPDIDGFEVCRRIRARAGTPVLFLSARSDEVDRIVGLELGADDYLVKPFSPRELVARVRAVLRRFEVASAAPPRQSLIEHGPLRLDLERHEVRWGGQVVALTATEFTVLAALIERPGIVLSRAQLMQRVYTLDTHVTERTIDTHVRRIRSKFRVAGGDPIATVHGVGYKAAELVRG
jgi:two-component system OmpR family response regulator